MGGERGMCFTLMVSARLLASHTDGNTSLGFYTFTWLCSVVVISVRLIGLLRALSWLAGRCKNHRRAVVAVEFALICRPVWTTALVEELMVLEILSRGDNRMSES